MSGHLGLGLSATTQFVRVVELLDSLLVTEVEVVLRAACLPELESLRHHGLHTAATVAVRRRRCQRRFVLFDLSLLLRLPRRAASSGTVDPADR